MLSEWVLCVICSVLVCLRVCLLTFSLIPSLFVPHSSLILHPSPVPRVVSKYEAAAFCYEELVLSNPTSHINHCRLGEIYYTLGGKHIAKARKYVGCIPA